ncbi:MAG: hypothetical protein RIQ71_1193 [Verrucomicrobiota bacterium]|jgi:hypothetical protein
MNPTIRIITIAFFAAFTLLPVRAQVPNILNYQGRVTIGGTNFNGIGQFKFALVRNDNTFVWRNDGATNGGEPATAVDSLVQQGLYSTLLGDATLSNMAAIPASVFTNQNINLRVWFSGGGTNAFVQVSPDQRIGSAAYAARAASADSVSGDVFIGPTNSLSFEGSTDNAFETRVQVADPTADRSIILPNSDGTLALTTDTVPLSRLGAVTAGDVLLGNSVGAVSGTQISGDMTISSIGVAAIASGAVTSTKIADNAINSAKIINGTIVDADISASAAILDTKLATISTAGKVANSATTASSANSPSAIVARDASGNFSAGTITATLNGNSSSATSAATASTLATGRTISLTGDVTATTSTFDGSANVSAAAAIASNAVTSGKIANGTIVDADISSSAAIAGSKVTPVFGAGSTSGGTNPVVGGGQNNSATADYAVVGGGVVNSNRGVASFIGGGQGNSVLAGATNIFVGGGEHNVADGLGTVIAGGVDNRVDYAYGAVGGGISNTNTSVIGTIAGGAQNAASGNLGTIAGGSLNKVFGFANTVGGGESNSVNAVAYATIAGGIENLCGVNASYASIGGGSGNTAWRTAATIPGGTSCEAESYAFAAGRRAKATNEGSFVWADSLDADFSSLGTNTFNLRASGGVFIRGDTNSGRLTIFPATSDRSSQIFLSENTTRTLGMILRYDGTAANNPLNFIGLTNGVETAPILTVSRAGRVGVGQPAPTATFQVVNATCDGSTWVNSSDRNLKTSFKPVDGGEILRKVSGLPISEWTYKASTNGSRHVGPTAQDFRAAFGLGDNDKTISTIDPSGIALAAIQGLVEELKDRDKTIEELKAKSAEVDVLKSELRALRDQVQSALPPAP